MNRSELRPAASVAAWSRAARRDTANGRLAARAVVRGRFGLFLRLVRRVAAQRAAQLVPLLAVLADDDGQADELETAGILARFGPARRAGRIRAAIGHLEVYPSHGPPASAVASEALVISP